MPEPLRESARDSRKSRVMEVAATLFARDGYHGTSVRDIARVVGVTPGAIYAHFESKSALLLAVYEAGVEAVAAAVEAALERDAPPWERLEAACAAHLAALTGGDPYARLVIRVLPGDEPAVAEALVRLRDGYEAHFRTLVGALDLAPGIDAGLLRLFLLGALNWAQTWYAAEGRNGALPAREVARQLLCVARRGAARGD
jgi:AcrR family transcriptional regulator